MTTPTTPGWYPDPQNRSLLRWHDGQQWTANTQPNATPTPQGPKRRKWPWIVGGLACILALFIGIGAAHESSKSGKPVAGQTLEPPTPTVATTPVTTERPPQSRCDSAPDQIVAIISAGLNDSSLELADTYSVTAPGGLVYVGANIMRGPQKVSSADVWVEDQGIVYALSTSAREYTLLPDGRRVLEVSAGDDYGTAVQECVIG